MGLDPGLRRLILDLKRQLERVGTLEIERLGELGRVSQASEDGQ